MKLSFWIFKVYRSDLALKTIMISNAPVFLTRFFSFLIIALNFNSFYCICDAHSFLLSPPPYSLCWNRGITVCPPMSKRLEHNHCVMSGYPTIANPYQAWKRNSSVIVTWARNNHRGGFVSFAIVPITLMFRESILQRYTFYYGCWEQGIHSCGGKEKCDVDRRGQAFSALLNIPSIIPDGVYAFSYVWYGGISRGNLKFQFPDYTSCSFIEIKGGPLTETFQPTFHLRQKNNFSGIERGGDKYVHGSTCTAFVRRQGICVPKCDRKTTFNGLPLPFNNGVLPQLLHSKLYNFSELGVCSSNVCVPQWCVSAEEKDCRKRKGGIINCCPSYITKYYNNRYCGTFAPPCIIQR